MPCKVIGIIGESKVGKTTTLNELFDRLIALNSSVIVGKKQEGENVHDFSCVLSYQSQKIAIFSMGDYVKAIKNAIRAYSDCDYLICAIRDDVLHRKSLLLPNDMKMFYLIRDEKDDEKDIVRKEKRDMIINDIMLSVSI